MVVYTVELCSQLKHVRLGTPSRSVRRVMVARVCGNTPVLLSYHWLSSDASAQPAMHNTGVSKLHVSCSSARARVWQTQPDELESLLPRTSLTHEDNPLGLK